MQLVEAYSQGMRPLARPQQATQPVKHSSRACGDESERRNFCRACLVELQFPELGVISSDHELDRKISVTVLQYFTILSLCGESPCR